MIDKGLERRPRDILVSKRPDGKRPGYGRWSDPGMSPGTSAGHGQSSSSSSSGGGGGGPPGGGGRDPSTRGRDPAPAAPDRQDRARQQAVVEKKQEEAQAIAEYAIREAKRIKETKPAHLGDTGFVTPTKYITKKPNIYTGPKKDILPEFEKRKIKTITGGNPFIDDVYEKKIVYEPSDLPKRAYDPRTDPNALLKRPGGIMSTIGGGLKKVFGDNPLEWVVNAASLGGYQKAKYAKALLDIKNRKGIYGTALKYGEKLTGKKLSNLTSTIDKAKATKFRDERTTLGKEDIEAWERKQDWSGAKPVREGGDGEGPKTIAEQVTQGTGLQSGQDLLGMDDKQIQQIYQGRDLLKQTIESGMYQDRKLNMNEMKMLQGHMMKMENLIQAIEKAQAPVNVAYGGRIDKALGGRSRDIG